MKKNLVNVIISNFKNLELPLVEKVKKAEIALAEAKATLETVTSATRNLTNGYAAHELIDYKVVEAGVDKLTGKTIRKKEFFMKPDMWIVKGTSKQSGEPNEWEINTPNTPNPDFESNETDAETNE